MIENYFRHNEVFSKLANYAEEQEVVTPNLNIQISPLMLGA
jgi:hypothetical protein